MEKFFDYEIKGDQRIKIKYNKLFAPVIVYIDGNEVHRFTSKKDVYLGSNFMVGHQKIYVRYMYQQENFQVKINDEYARNSAGHPNRFLSKLSVGPYILGVLSLLHIFYVYIFNYGVFSTYNNQITEIITLVVTFFRISIAIGLTLRKSVFYNIGFLWFILELIVSVLDVFAGGYRFIVAIIIKLIIIIHFIRHRKNYLKLRDYKSKVKNKDTSQVIDQF